MLKSFPHKRVVRGTAGLAVLASLAFTQCVAAQITIIGKAITENPSLCIASLDGPAEMASRFRRVLGRADWFTIVSNPQGADYVFEGRYTGGAQAALAVDVRTSAGGGFRFRQPAPGGDPGRLIFAAVDALIRAAFKTPGPCLSRIAFVVGQRGHKEVFTCNFDGTGARQITFNGTISTEPAWGQGAGKLVYTLYQNNTTSVVLMDLQRQTQRRLSWFPGLNAGARLSPDGGWVALSLSRDDRVELYLLSTTTRQLRRLTKDNAVDSSPCWSPDGARLCFVSDRFGQPRLFVMASRGGAARPLLTDPAEAVSPDWSLVSNKICYAKRMGPNYQIAVVDMSSDAREATTVTRAAGDWESPSWAPDGRHVVCSRQQGSRRGLWMVDTWFGTARAVTQPDDHSLPSWSGRR